MTDLQQQLAALADEDYRLFHQKLVPNLDPGTILGVRVPKLRQFAKALDCEERGLFLQHLPHEYYEENMLHALLLERQKDFQAAVAATEAFLPYVDNWAVCDTLKPKVFAKHKSELLPHIERWIDSPLPYTCRFGLEMLMTHFLDDDFKPEYALRPLTVTREEYYVCMMIAWFYATALAKQWDAVIPVLEQRLLPEWTHRKAIQKACESCRVTPEQKEYLKSLK